MSGFDAYDDEMRLRGHLSERDLDRLLTGSPLSGDERDDELASFIADLKESYLEAPESSVETRHLAAVVDAAAVHSAESEHSGAPKRRKAMLRRRLALTAAAAFAIVPLTAGLAVAGVTLPAPAQTAFERLGLELPNQAGASEGAPVSDAVLAVVFGPDEKGCAFGLKVADAADANRRDAGQGPPENPCERGQNGDGNGQGGNGNGSGEHGRETGEDASEFGQETAEEARSLGGNAADGGGREFGESTAEEAKNQGAGGSQGGGPSIGDDASAGGRSTGDKASENGDGASERGRSIGDEASQGGRAIGGQASGGHTP